MRFYDPIIQIIQKNISPHKKQFYKNTNEIKHDMDHAHNFKDRVNEYFRPSNLAYKRKYKKVIPIDYHIEQANNQFLYDL